MRKLCNAYEENDYYTDCLDGSDESLGTKLRCQMANYSLYYMF